MSDTPRESPAFADTRPTPTPLAAATTDLHDARSFSRPRLCLEVVLGRDAGKRFRLRQGNNVLGRGGHGFSDKEISREHALIVLRGGEASIMDMGSTNGTFVGVEQISAPRRLQIGETFYLGKRTLVLLTNVVEPSERP